MNIGDQGWRPTEVHPLAALFPMMEEDDLADLAADIKEHGLRIAIEVDAEGRLVDGRNRSLACDRAGVEPHYNILNGEDIEALIWSLNAKRRNMTKGQTAMVAALAAALPSKAVEHGLDGRFVDKGNAKAARDAGVSPARLSQAVSVRDHATHLVDDVKSGKLTLNSAYAAAQENKRQHDRLHNSLDTLKKVDKDLAQKVMDREMSADEAFKEIDERKNAIRAKRDSALMGLRALHGLVGFEKSEALRQLPEQLLSDDGEQHLREYFKGGAREVAETLASAKLGLLAIEKVWAKVKVGGGE